jgi:hypothetical protein
MAVNVVTSTQRDEALAALAAQARDVSEAIIDLANVWEANYNALPEGFGEEGYPFQGSAEEVAYAVFVWASGVAVEAAQTISGTL